MAVTFQAVGTAVSAGTSALTLAWPAGHTIYDVALMFVTSSGGGITQTLNTAAGFTLIGTYTTGSGVSGTKLSVYWARATSTAMASPVIAGGPSFKYGFIATFRGVLSSATPYDIVSGNFKTPASTTTNFNDITTTMANTMIVNVLSSDASTTAAFVTSYTNANLTNLTKQFDAGTTSGDGGGISFATGTFAGPGTVGATTAVVTSTINAFATIALIPEPPITSIANNFEGGTDGVAITDANSGGVSGRAIVTTARNNGTTLTFSSVRARDTLSMKGTYTLAGAGYAVWSWTSSQRTATRLYLYCEGIIDEGYVELIRMRNTSATIYSISITVRLLEVFNSAGTRLFQAAVKIQPDSWYRIEVAATIGTTTTNGRIEAALYDNDSIKPIFSYDSGATTNTGTTNFDTLRVGMAAGPLNNPMNIYFDDMATQEKTSGFIGPSATGTTYDTTQFLPFF